MFDGRKVLWVAGGRDYNDYKMIHKNLHDNVIMRGYEVLVTGAARGADSVAQEIWRNKFQAPYVGIPAEWGEYNKAAGPIRNRVIGDEYPDGLLLFPGGRGTTDAREVAEERGIEIIYAEEVR